MTAGRYAASSMSKTILVVGFGPGISTAVAEKFGGAGFAVGLVGRTESRLTAGVAALQAKGITAAAFPGDAGDPGSIREAVKKARAQFGPITVLHWNAYGGGEAGDLLSVEPSSVRGVFDVAVVGLLAAVQEVVADLKTAKDGAVLVTNGAFGELTPEVDAYAISLKAMGVALGNAAKNKLVGLLSERLKGDGVYVGEVMVAGTIKGTAWANESSIDAAKVADLFWKLYQDRGAVRARIS